MKAFHLDYLVGNDDAVMHDLFSAARQMSRLSELPVASLSVLTDLLDRRTGAFEDMTVGELLAMVADVQVAA